MKVNDVKLTNEYDVCGAFNDYFTNAPLELNRAIPDSDIAPSSYLGSPVMSSFFVAPCTNIEVENLIKISKNKGCSLDQVPVFIIKQVIKPFSAIISQLFNESIITGVFPSILRSARIVPIFKKGNCESVQNYRPISILSFTSKLFEKLMYKRLISFLSMNEVLVDNQFGFRKGFSTSDAIVQFLDSIYNDLNSNCSSIAVFLDFTKAFETVNHGILLRKLNHYGVRGVANAWFKSYLYNRSQYVSLNGVTSSIQLTNISVPQGSVLGPLLFILYINDMHSSRNHVTLTHYADDTTALLSNRDVSILVQDLNADLYCINQWLEANRLTLNTSKSAFMLFGRGFPADISVNINGEPLQKVSQTKFLGVTIDEKLNFKPHVEDVLKKLSSVSGIIWRSKNSIPRHILKLIYLSLANSYMSYGILAWGRCSLTSIAKVDKAQRRIIKYIYGANDNTVFHLNKILKFKNLYYYFALRKFYKELHEPNTDYFQERVLSLQSGHNYPTRFASQFNLVGPRLIRSSFRASYLYQAVECWNQVPLSIKNCNNYKKFSSSVRIHLLNGYVT